MSSLTRLIGYLAQKEQPFLRKKLYLNDFKFAIKILGKWEIII